MYNQEYIYPSWNVPKQIKSVITTKKSGYSTGKYTSFNLATHVGDEPQTVIQNRQLLKQVIPSEPLWLNQTHSINILDTRYKNSDSTHDAVIITNKNQVGVIMTADCAPILISNIKGTFVAAIHAGWRGTVNGIISKTIQKVNLPTSDMLIYIGPTICQNHFEVGLECYEQFIKHNKENIQYFNEYNSKYFCDLVGIIRLNLLKCGISEKNIYTYDGCTFCDSENFYSYRRDGLTGRIASLIWLN